MTTCPGIDGGASSTDEVVAVWLQAELRSSRFAADLRRSLAVSGWSEDVITTPDLSDAVENAARWQILRGYSWLDFDLLEFGWHKRSFNQSEVSGLQYIDYSYWNKLSDDTRLVGRAVANVLQNKVVFDVPNDGFRAMARGFEAGVQVPPIVLLSHGRDEPPEIIEGHLRATGYVLAKAVQHPLRAIVGTRAV